MKTEKNLPVSNLRYCYYYLFDCLQVQQAERFNGNELTVFCEFVQGAGDHLEADRYIVSHFHEVETNITFFINGRRAFQAFEDLERNPFVIHQRKTAETFITIAGAQPQFDIKSGLFHVIKNTGEITKLPKKNQRVSLQCRSLPSNPLEENMWSTTDEKCFIFNA